MASAVPGAELAIDAEGVEKTFGRAIVLRDVTLAVGAGETVALFGPNGAGKTTLLRLCATLYEPTRGRLRLLGGDAGSAKVRRRIGFVGHQSFLYPDLTAHENLVFYGRLYGFADAAARADAWLARVALADVAARPVRVFSRGMEQRVALARALLHEPELVLLDEPWSGLDPGAADLLTGLLAELRRDGRTVVVATHDFDRGLAVADRAAILHRGRVAWDGVADAAARASMASVYQRVTGAVAA